MNIPILRPRLPKAEALLPYLRLVDNARLYSNFGPLIQEFESRLAERFALPPSSVATGASATALLTAALLAQEPPPGSLCVMPAWTFVASPLAAIAAGLVPYFVDVAPEDWLIQPKCIANVIAKLPGRVGAVMPVAPFGYPVDIATWDRFRRETQLAIVVDSAAGFDAVQRGDTLNVVSLHATKALASGEGGFVVSRNSDLIAKIRSHLNFGFSGDRQAHVAGVNGKMSEYHAAVGLAALDEWSATRQELRDRALAYSRAFEGCAAVEFQPGFGHNWVATTCVISLSSGIATRIGDRLSTAGVDTRAWWAKGAHLHPVTRAYPRSALEVTERLVRSTIGLPFYVDLDPRHIERIAALVREAATNLVVDQQA